MVIGIGENKEDIYLIDFEIAKKYILNGQHIPYRVDEHIKGNRDYISINTHRGIEISRRDDIESLGYNIIYFMKGKLPWSDIRDSSIILDKKINTNLDCLCEGLPEEFQIFITYARALQFYQVPDYNYLKELLIQVGEKNGIYIDKVKYDWEIKNEEIEQKEKDEKLKKIEEEKVKEKKEEKKDENEKEKEEEKEENSRKLNEEEILKKEGKTKEDENIKGNEAFKENEKITINNKLNPH